MPNWFAAFVRKVQLTYMCHKRIRLTHEREWAGIDKELKQDLRYAIDHPEEGLIQEKWLSTWAPYLKVRPERRSKFILGLTLLARCLCPDVGAYRLTWDDCSRNNRILLYSTDEAEQLRARDYERKDSFINCSEISPEMVEIFRVEKELGRWEALFAHDTNGQYFGVHGRGCVGEEIHIFYSDTAEAQELLRQFLHSRACAELESRKEEQVAE